ncbi:MAG TPA: diguanylate cyclase [Verrucomicrobiae bacterium]|nr:diguanylate cyclase [Verrucomicrobiae bacterium]
MQKLFRSLSEKALDYYVVSSGKVRDIEVLKRAKVAVVFAITYASCGCVFAPLYYRLGSPAGALAIVVSDVLILLAPVSLRRTGSNAIAGNWIVANVYWLIAYLATLNGGQYGPSLAWLVTIPVAATLLCGRSSGMLWTALAIFQMLAFYLLGTAGFHFADQFSPEVRGSVRTISLSFLTFLALNFALIYEHFNAQTIELIRGLAVIDETTQTLNLRGFIPLARQQLRLATRDQRGLAMLYFVVNGIQGLLDSGNTDAADRLMARTAAILAGTFRSSDLLSRVAPDRFVVSVLSVGAAEIDILFGRLIVNLERMNSQKKAEVLRLMMGAVPAQPDKNTTVEDLLEKVQEDMRKKSAPGGERGKF